MVVTFPRKLLTEADHDWNIIGNTAVSGQTTGSSVDIRSDGGGFWYASLNNIRFRDPSYTLLWRAVRQICNGGVNPLIVYRNDTPFIPFPVNQYGIITHSDGSPFSDGTGYYQPVIDVTANGSAANRATSMSFDLNYCGPLQGGECFSIEHPTYNWRIYEIATVDQVGSVANITFNPPLREAVPDGTRIEFDRPRCTMKLQNSASMDFNVTSYPFSLASVKFVESKYAT